MNIKSAKYFRSILSESDFPQESLPQFAFIGRSNVGKSSFINTITGQKDLCRSGSTPGVTQKVNLFLINNDIYFADLPGYGYAKMMRGERKKLEDTIFWYLQNPRNQFKQIFLLIDGEIGPTSSDLEVLDFLDQQNLPTTIIASKIDKLKAARQAQGIKKAMIMMPNHEIIPFSSKTGVGKKTVQDRITTMLKE